MLQFLVVVVSIDCTDQMSRDNFISLTYSSPIVLSLKIANKFNDFNFELLKFDFVLIPLTLE